MEHTGVDQVLDTLARHPDRALFATELHVRLGRPADFEERLADLGDAVLVVDHPAPDPHLAGDLRVVALAAPPATDPPGSAERVWTAWMRDVLSAHRCC